MASSESTGIIQSSAFSRRMSDYDAALQGALLSRGQFNFYFGLCLLWGFAINALICLLFSEQIILFAANHVLMFLIGYCICAFGGIFISGASSNPVVSFLGYNLVVLPLGALLCLVVSMYPLFTVAAAFVATAAVTGVMLIASSVYPRFFLKLGSTLFIALLACVIIEIVLALFGFTSGIFDWIIALIFCGYIGFDWSRAQLVPSTLDNAIDCACSIYVDIINLFIRILSIMGRRRN